MKQGSLLIMMSKSVPTEKEDESDSKENKKIKEMASPCQVLSSDSTEGTRSYTNNSVKQDKSNFTHEDGNIAVKKRLKLAKQGKDNEVKQKAVTLNTLSNINKLPMMSEDRSRSKSENDNSFDNIQQDGEQMNAEKEKAVSNVSSTSTTSASQADHIKTKETISYSDFLAMFQNSSSEVSQNIHDDSTQDDNNDSEGLEREEFKVKENGKKSDIANCKNIASYFKPSKSKSITGTSQVITTADIHTSSFNSDDKPLCSDSVLNMSCEIVNIENMSKEKTYSEKDEEIVLLSSEIIEEDFEGHSVEVPKGKQYGRKKKNKEMKSVMKANAETGKRSADEIISSPNLSLTAVSRDVSDKKSPQSTFQQSTLSFSKSGLSVCKTGGHHEKDPGCHVQDSSDIKDDDDKLIEKSEKTTETTEELTVVTRKGPEEAMLKNCQLKTDNNRKIHDEGNKTAITESFKTSRVTDIQQENVKLRRSNGNGSQSKSAAQDLLQTNLSEVDSQNEAPSTPVLRRSSRIKTSLQATKEVEVMEIDVEDIDKTGDAKKPKKSKQQTLTKEKISVKPAGKLAPIFMKSKAVEEEPKKIEPPEDPEKVRARQEFLMSGIPDELRRIIVATASSCIEADYPPFPQRSHVQQILPQTMSSPNLSTFRLRAAFEEEDFDCSWSKVHLAIDSGMSPIKTDHCKNFSYGQHLDESQTELLLAKMEASDSAFPFRDTVNNCVKKRNTQESCAPVSEDLVIVDDESPSVVKQVSQTSDAAKDYLWSDLYQPCHSQEVIGNVKAIKQLKEWLIEWHSLMQKEVQKAAKGKKPQKRPFNTDADWSADSDFTDSDEEDSRLCNTMLLTGPHGIGKTSAVYGLAQEIGFKVFEVNASSLRSGKQLLCQLEEATQSHRVASNNIPESAVQETPPAGTKVHDQKPSSAMKPKSASNSAAFANLFRKASNSAKSTDKINDKMVDQGGKKKQSSKAMEKKESKDDCPRRKSRKRKAPDVEIKAVEAGPKISGRALNITSTSLILFDEADIVFEEDKGFLATVQHFMTSTKIPIILTSTDPSLHDELEPRHHHVILKQPSLKSTVGFLYSVCLASGIHSNYHSLSNLVKMLNGDLRRCLLQLQFWCESGGGRDQTRECSNKDFSPQLKFSAVQKPLLASPLDEDACGSKLESCKPIRKRPRMILDDDSNSSEAPTHVSDQESSVPMLSSDQALPEKTSVKSDSVSMSQVKEKPVNDWPVLHYGCDALLVGKKTEDISGEALVNLLKASYDSASQIASFINHYASLRRQLYRDIIYSVALHCCSLPLTSKAPTVLEIHSGKPDKEISSKRKRKRILSDCFDSEGSDDEKENGSEKNTHGNPSLAVIQDKQEVSPLESEMTNTSIPSHDNDLEMKQGDRNDGSKEGRGVGIDSKRCHEINEKESKKEPSDDYLFHVRVLSHFSRFYDDRSCVDLLEAPSDSDNPENSLKPGVEDQLTSKDSVTLKSMDSWQDLYSCIDLLSARTFTSGMCKCVQKRNEMLQNLTEETGSMHSDSWRKDFELPIGTSLPDIWASSKKKSRPSRDPDGDLKDMTDCLGLWTHGSNPSIYTDYLPILREVCRFECERQASNKKRRFHHYFDHIGLGLKESTITSLSSTYTVIND